MNGFPKSLACRLALSEGEQSHNVLSTAYRKDHWHHSAANRRRRSETFKSAMNPQQGNRHRWPKAGHALPSHKLIMVLTPACCRGGYTPGDEHHFVGGFPGRSFADIMNPGWPASKTLFAFRRSFPTNRPGSFMSEDDRNVEVPGSALLLRTETFSPPSWSRSGQSGERWTKTARAGPVNAQTRIQSGRTPSLPTSVPSSTPSSPAWRA